MMKFISGITFAVLLSGTTAVHAQVNAADSVMTHAKGNKLSLGGYGEAAYSRNFTVIMVIVIRRQVFIRRTQAMEDLIFRMPLSILVMILEKVGL